MPQNREKIIQQLTNGMEKAWFKVGTLAAKDRMPGDRKIVFSKQDMRLAIYECNYTLHWEEKEAYSWNVEFDNIAERLKLKVNGKFCEYAFDDKRGYLTLRLPNWKEPIILQ